MDFTNVRRININYGLAAILAFPGLKMLISEFYEVLVGVSLGVVPGILLISALFSLVRPGRNSETWEKREE